MKNEEQILECREKYPLRTSYAEFVKEYQIRDNTILYEAFGGRGMICNPYALFLYLLEKEEYQDYTHIWVLEDFEDNRKQIEKYEKYPNVRFVKYKSKELIKLSCDRKQRKMIFFLRPMMYRFVEKSY